MSRRRRVRGERQLVSFCTTSVSVRVVVRVRLRASERPLESPFVRGQSRLRPFSRRLMMMLAANVWDEGKNAFFLRRRRQIRPLLSPSPLLSSAPLTTTTTTSGASEALKGNAARFKLASQRAGGKGILPVHTRRRRQ